MHPVHFEGATEVKKPEDMTDEQCIPAIYGEGAMAYAPWLYTCQMNYAALRVKCDRYEKALKEINGSGGKLIPHKHEMIAIANEALSGEGKEVVPAQWWEGLAIHELPTYVKVITDKCAEVTGLYCKVFKWSIINAVTNGDFGAEIEGYEPDYLCRPEFNYPGQIYGRLNICHLIPATEEEFEAYITHSNNK